MNRDQTYANDQINSILAATLPQWALQGDHITRTFKTSGWKATLMVVNAVGHLAELAWHHPEIMVSYAAVDVRLQSHDVGGITDRDFELARKIEEFVSWRPGAEEGALTGIPEGKPHFAYIKHED